MGPQRLRTGFVAIFSLLIGAGLVSLLGQAQHDTSQDTTASMKLYVKAERALAEGADFEAISEALTTEEEESLQALKMQPQLFLERFPGVGASKERIAQNRFAASHAQQRNARQGVPLRQRNRPAVSEKVAALGERVAAMGASSQQDEVPATKGRSRSGPILGCKQFEGEGFRWPEGMQTVAVVGNGPLKPADRQEIEESDLVMRFNKLQSYTCGEKMNVWVARHGDSTPSRFWGIDMKLNKTGCPMDKLLTSVDSLWLLNGGDAPFQYFISKHPEVQEMGNYLWVDGRRWVRRYFQQYDPNLRAGLPPSSQEKVSPSSGWLLLMMLLDCAPKGVQLHVYGFNWAKGQWPAHKTQSEENEIHALANEGRITLHPTLCEAKHTCKEEAAAPVVKRKSWRTAISELVPQILWEDDDSADTEDSVPSF